MNKCHTLQFPVRHDPVSESAVIHPGYRYCINAPKPALTAHAGHVTDTDYELQSGIVGAYRLGARSADIEPVDPGAQPAHCFVWDTDLLSPAVSRWLRVDSERLRSPGHNRLTLHDATLEGPEVRLQNNHSVLTISPRFALEWATEAFASQLGWVQLVESSRTLQFEDGESLVLLDTEAANVGPVLYLSDATGSLAVKPACAFQQRGERQGFCCTTEVTQIIPAEFQERAVASVSVLEKYTCYFMQNAAPDDHEHHIWVPVHLPIVWGWSIRVQQRFDGIWDIFRKKLMMPMPSTEAAALPCWRSNSLLCRTSMDN